MRAVNAVINIVRLDVRVLEETGEKIEGKKG